MFVAGVNTEPDQRENHVRRARMRVGVLICLLAIGFVVARTAWSMGHTAHSWLWFAAAVVFLFGCVVARGTDSAWPVRVAASIAVACFAGGVFTLRVLEVSPSRVDRVVPDAAVVTLEGRVRDTPVRVRPSATVLGAFGHQEPAWTLVLATRRVRGDAGWHAATGNTRVFLRGEAPPAVRAGDLAHITGEFRHETGSGNPGDGSWMLWRNQHGRAGVLDVPGLELVESTTPGAWDRAVGLALHARAALRDRAQHVVERASGTDPARRALIENLLLGRTEVGVESTEVSGVFTRLGLVHVLSISGFHLTVMAALALWVLRLTGDRGCLEPLALCAIVLCYMAIVPASSPILRSGAMVVSLLAVEATGRRYDRLCVLGWIAAALLVWRPLDLWGLGFQLSLGLTAMLLSAGERFTEGMFTPVLRGLVDDATLAQRVRRGLRAALAVSVMCWVVSLPVIMHTAGLVSPVAILATLVVSPIVVALLWVGYSALLLGVVIPWAGTGSAWVVERLGGVALWAASWMDTIPFSSVRVPIVPAWWAVLATAVAVAWAHTLSWGRWRWLGVWTVLAALLAITWIATPMTPRGVALRVDTLNVGDGACMLVRSGDEAILWDCKAARGGTGSLPGVVNAARALGVWRVRRAIITHPDLDHFSGLPEVVEALGVEEVLVPQRFVDVADADERSAPAALLEWLKVHRVHVRVVGAGDTERLGAASVRFLWPSKDARSVAQDHDNDYSLVAVVEHANARVLLTGDVQERAIRELRAVELLPISAMELPHHGAWSRESEAWLEQVSPRVVLQSTGAARAADVRWDDAKARGALWHLTSERGWCGVDVMEDGSVCVVR